jgi:peroxiredoxin
MPSIQKLRDKLAGQPFAVLAVNLDEPESRITAFLEKTKLDLTVVLDPAKSVSKAWNARILPASYVVDRDGRVRYSVVGDIDWNDARVLKIVTDLMHGK